MSDPIKVRYSKHTSRDCGPAAAADEEEAVADCKVATQVWTLLHFNFCLIFTVGYCFCVKKGESLEGMVGNCVLSDGYTLIVCPPGKQNDLFKQAKRLGWGWPDLCVGVNWTVMM